jgi:site-specific DNA-adenine methylase
MSNYFGSKATSGLCQPIIAMMPPHDTYIETHLGGGAIMQRKPPALKNIAIDLDPEALSSFKCGYLIEKVNSCAHEFLSDYTFHGRELVYCDPPYLHCTRSSSRRYRFDYEEQDHIELLKLLKKLNCSVMLSGYPSPLYDELLADWGCLELQVMNHGGVRTEKLWFNFTPDRVHWPRFAGKNFTDRQRIKRKAENWGKRYQALPRAERLAVLSSIMAVEAQEME